MKKLLCLILTIIISLSLPLSAHSEEAFTADFESDSSGLTLFGNAKRVDDSESGSSVLYLDGSSSTYAAFPSGLFDGVDTATVLFDIKPVSSEGNFFTFAIGQSDSKYSFLRLRGSEIRNAITVNSYTDERETKAQLPCRNAWLSVALVFEGVDCKLYVNGEMRAENQNTGIKLSDLGSGLSAYLGKSFYSGDGYYQGYFDNIKVFKSVLSDSDIKSCVSKAIPMLYNVTVGSTVENPESVSGADSHTAVYASLDRNGKTVSSYVKASQNLSSVPVKLSLSDSLCKAYLNGKEVGSSFSADLSGAKTLKITKGEKEETYTISVPKKAKNPVLGGQFADPDIDILDGRFWLYPTTDGIAGWGGSQFHAFSSLDLVNWIDEGVILDTKDKTQKKNAQGVNIAVSPWSDGNAWAPAIEGKNGKYYFYYCGAIKSEYSSLYGNGMAIGVAWASSPSGPFTALSAPILYPKLLEESGIGFSGQVIDPAVFTDDDGTSYLLFGNGSAATVKLGSNMTSVDKSSFRLLTGLNDFRESIAVFKKGSMYYYTWSCDDTGSENYHINWGYSSSLGGKIYNKGTLLSKNESAGILGTGHQSVLYIPKSGKCFIAYHRFYTPLSQVDSGFGFHREICIDEITFTSGLFDSLNPVTPTHEGTGAYDISGNKTSEKIPTHYKQSPAVTPAAPVKITVKATAVSKLIAGKKQFTVKWKKVSGATGYQIQYSLKKNMKGKKTVKATGTKKTVKKLKAKKKYYVRIRAYKKSGNKIYYSNWSKVKSVKTK